MCSHGTSPYNKLRAHLFLRSVFFLMSKKLLQQQRATMEKGWSDRVEDLVDNGDVDGAISLLETVIANLETLGSSSSSSSSPSGDLRLATALSDLADIHSSRGFSIKADELQSRALLVRARAVDPPAALKSTSVFNF